MMVKPKQMRGSVLGSIGDARFRYFVDPGALK
jgi:hypothetical protein